MAKRSAPTPKGENAASSPAAENEGLAAEAAPERNKNKRKVPASKSCIRTDLLELSPNDGKAGWLERYFGFWRDACSQMLSTAWSDWLSGKKRAASDALWKTLGPPNPLATHSTVLQPAEREVKAVLESHTGLLASDVKRLIGDWKEEACVAASKIADEAVRGLELSSIRRTAHELYSINKAKAWMLAGEGRKEPIVHERKFGPDGEALQEFDVRAASGESFDIASKLFLEASKGRSPPRPMASKSN